MKTKRHIYPVPLDLQNRLPSRLMTTWVDPFVKTRMIIDVFESGTRSMQGKVTNEVHVLNLINLKNVSENKELFSAVVSCQTNREHSFMFTYIV